MFDFYKNNATYFFNNDTTLSKQCYLVHPFLETEWEWRECGTEEKYTVECPKHWGQLACDLAATRYLRRGSVPDWEGYFEEGGMEIVPPIFDNRENSIKQLIHRIAMFMALHNEMFDDQLRRYNYYLDLCYLLVNQIIAFNTPVWINAGLYDVYGIKGSRRTRYWFDPDKNKVVPVEYEQLHPGLAACYLTKVEDSLHGDSSMYNYINTESLIFAMGAGNGANISNIRGKGEPITGGGHSEGLLPFLKIPDASASYIKSGGVSRRAARMLICDIDHPDVESFITWKGNEEKKVGYMADSICREYKKELEEAGTPESIIKEKVIAKWYELTDWRGDLYNTVSGQQANNSIRIADEFFEAVKNDEDWLLTYRTDPNHKIPIKARQLWDTICKQAWTTGDPGLAYDNAMQAWNTVSHYGEVRVFNPCGEVSQPDFASCNLCSVNLLKFFKKRSNSEIWASTIDFVNVAHIVTLSLETVAHYCSHPTKEHAKTTYELRPLGANLGNIGAFLTYNCLPYDSDEGRKTIAAATGLFTAACWNASKEMAKVLGSYPAYLAESHGPIIAKHIKYMMSLSEYVKSPNAAKDDLASYLASEAGNIYANFDVNIGFRNDAVTCYAPMGTVGLIMDCDTLGIEPAFALKMYKKLSEGGGVVIVNNGVKQALLNLGYSNEEVETMAAKIIESGSVVGIVKPEEEAIFDCAQPCSSGRFIHPNGHVDMLGAVQPAVSLSMSKTVNLPHNATVEDVSNILWRGWEKGLKDIALYRDGCKISQPLNMFNGNGHSIKEDVTDEEIADALSSLEEALKA